MSIKYIKQAKSTIGLGILTSVGTRVTGGNAAVSGGLNLLNIGNLAKTGMMVAGVKGKKGKKKSSNSVVNNILG